ncbi:glycosyl hydrolase family 20, catalytic domain-containing protein [Phthorimaea operculella]|nr:glycosyl hydrolase family 20, catalytic domain-containing protein [Phthorimaea operculella]
MLSVLLYHCCVSSHSGAIEDDICRKMTRVDREMILKYCEDLSQMEITINNVEIAIQNACDFTQKAGPSKRKRCLTPPASKAAVQDSRTSESESIALTDGSSKKMKIKKVSALTFKASVTVMPSHISVNNSSTTFSKISSQADSSLDTTDNYSTKLDCSETTSLDSVAVFGASALNRRIDSLDSRFTRSESFKRDSNLSCPVSPVVSRKNSRRSHINADQAYRLPEYTKEVQMKSYREVPRKCPGGTPGVCCRHQSPSSESEGTCPRPCQRYSSESGGDSAKSNILQPDTIVARTDSSPCLCAVSTNGEASDVCPAGDMRDCKGYIGVNEQNDAGKNAWNQKKRGLCGEKNFMWRLLGVILAIIFVVLIAVAIFFIIKVVNKPDKGNKLINTAGEKDGTVQGLIDDQYWDDHQDHDHSAKRSAQVGTLLIYPTWAWQCTKDLCMKVYKPKQKSTVYSSLSRCILLCTGPQLWPHPIGQTNFSKKLVALATDRLEYKFQVALASDMVTQYLAEAFGLFLADLARLERINHKNRNGTHDIEVTKMLIHLEVESDTDPRMRLNTDESYHLKVSEVADRIEIKINSPSFAGVRHGLETLSQIILLDQSTGFLITLSEAIVKDAPSYKYRGLMLDTARHYLPLIDILRTVDGMATCKLNTLHWRITDSASFPLHLPSLEKLFEYGAYGRDMVYTKEDVKMVVDRAGVRGIRVLLEVAVPGPVGRAWSWSNDLTTCPKKNDNFTCEDVICLRLKMQHKVFELLQHLYSEIIGMTGVDDMFHLSDSVFSLSNCYNLIEERKGFLENALERLRKANKGFLPKLPIIWYTQHLAREMNAKTWERYGVQVYDWPNHPDGSLSRYKVIHSGRWDLSCDVKKGRCTKYRSWQEMYSWTSWHNMEAFSTEGGEAVLWTDLVDSGNLDFHLWPRAAVVAERLWSDLVVNGSASGDVYMRLDSHRWRMLLRGIQVQPIWPVWCSFNPAPCLAKIIQHRHQ